MVLRASSRTKISRMRFTSARVRSRATTASALALLAIAAVCPALESARAQEGLFDRIFGGSERFGGERAAQPAAGQPPDRGGPPSGPDLMVRVDRLEAQIRQLTGVIEQLQYRNQQLEGQVRRMQEDPRALQSRPQTLPPQSSPAVTATPGRRGDAFDPTQYPNAPGAPHTLGSVAAAGGPPTMSSPPQPGPDGQGAIGAPGGRGAGAPLDIATMSPPSNQAPGQPPRNPNAGGAVATLPPSNTPRDEYDLAYGYVLRKDYALAEEGFRNFLSKYPTDRLAGDATYWFGESLFQRQRYRDAAEAFLNVSTKYESTAKAPDALLRLGQSLAALGEKEAACASLGEVMRKFPRASAVVKQGVEREQKRVRC
jgi:tol-pal system protein YbgF